MARPLIVGERTNANGSRKFRDAMLAGDLARVAVIARDEGELLSTTPEPSPFSVLISTTEGSTCRTTLA